MSSVKRPSGILVSISQRPVIPVSGYNAVHNTSTEADEHGEFDRRVFGPSMTSGVIRRRPGRHKGLIKLVSIVMVVAFIGVFMTGVVVAMIKQRKESAEEHEFQLEQHQQYYQQQGQQNITRDFQHLPIPYPFNATQEKQDGHDYRHYHQQPENVMDPGVQAGQDQQDTFPPTTSSNATEQEQDRTYHHQLHHHQEQQTVDPPRAEISTTNSSSSSSSSSSTTANNNTDRDLPVSLPKDAPKSIETVIKTKKNGDLSSKDLQLASVSDNTERVIVLSNMCILPGERWVVYTKPENGMLCRNSGSSFVFTNCDSSMFHIAAKEAEFPNLEFQMMNKSTLSEIRKLNWINDPLAIFHFVMSAENIAHYAGIVFLYHRVLQNLQAFGLGEKIPKVLVLTEKSAFNVQRTLTNGDSWQLGALGAILRLSFTRDKAMEDFVESHDPFSSWMNIEITSDLINDYQKNPNRYYFNAASYNTLLTSYPDGICFQKVIIPAFLKNRYFMSYPENHDSRPNVPELVDIGEGKMPVPRDAWDLRKTLYRIFTLKQTVLMKKKVLYVPRKRRRAFDEESESKFRLMLTQLAKQYGYETDIVTLGKDFSFQQQVEVFWDAALYVGIHGANLVNAIFLPAGAAMIEIMPYRFDHMMYRNGSNSGVYYKSYKVLSGKESPLVSSYQSATSCIMKNVKCKVFYRADKSEIHLIEKDYEEMSKIIVQCLKYLSKPIRALPN